MKQILFAVCLFSLVACSEPEISNVALARANQVALSNISGSKAELDRLIAKSYRRAKVINEMGTRLNKIISETAELENSR